MIHFLQIIPKSKISVLRSKIPCQLAGIFAGQVTNFSLQTSSKNIRIIVCSPKTNFPAFVQL